MPKQIPPWGMEEADFKRLKAAITEAGKGAGGICVGISFDWIDRLFAPDNVTIPASFAEQDLGPLIAAQLAYRQMTAGMQPTEDSLVAYGATRGITLKQLLLGGISRDDGSFDEKKDFPPMSKGKAYLLNFSTDASGPRLGHVAALYRGGTNSIAIRDQNIGQLSVNSRAELKAEYEKVMMHYYADEVSPQRELARETGGREKMTSPEYRFWTFYEVTHPTSPEERTCVIL